MLRAEGMIPVEDSSAGSRTSIRMTGLWVGEVVVDGRELFIWFEGKLVVFGLVFLWTGLGWIGVVVAGVRRER